MRAFSSPELLRAPLERLILKIKIWDETINRNDREDQQSSKLLREPEKILGRAIEPPQIQNIASAINNLILYGALTKEPNSSGKLTELGKVYAELPIDLRYSRLIMLANAFDLIEPAIVVACILSQDKSIFRRQMNPVDAYNMRVIHSNECDFTIMFNIYKHWEELYGKDVNTNRRGWKRDKSESENEFCNALCLNATILREVKMAIADVWNRLQKLSLVNVRADNDEGIFKRIIHFSFDIENRHIIFKIILAGGFYPRFIKCQNIYEWDKIKRKNKYSDLKRSIVVKG
jgi:HrpA-like RNA helicase